MAKTTSQITLENVPEDIVIYICKFLNVTDLSNLAAASSQLRMKIENISHNQLTIEESMFQKNSIDQIVEALMKFNKYEVKTLKFIRVTCPMEKIEILCRHLVARRLILFKSLSKENYSF